MKKKVAIIGGGSSALVLAAMLDEAKFEVAIYERNIALGRKFLVAGDGGFNLTHSEDNEQFISRYSPENFIKDSIAFFNNKSVCEWFKRIGIETYIGSSKRVFPVKGVKPIDVLNAILVELKRKNVDIKTSIIWKGWDQNRDLVFSHKEEELVVKADIKAFALGGKSWRVTGSDGGWFPVFEKAGIAVKPFYPSNCAYEVQWSSVFLEQAEGKWLKNCSINCEGFEKKGELVITKFGLEGNAIYALSPQIRAQLLTNSYADIYIDLKPSLSTAAIRNKIPEKKSKSVSACLKDNLNLTEAQVAVLKERLSKDEFNNWDILIHRIKKLPIRIINFAPIDEAISTVGGVNINEVDKNFQLHKLPGNYVIGEMLDWDAPTGGYLLQACFSMGAYLADKLNK